MPKTGWEGGRLNAQLQLFWRGGIVGDFFPLLVMNLFFPNPLNVKNMFDEVKTQ